MTYRAYIYGLPRSGNCLLWRLAKYMVGEPATLDDFLKYRFGSILRSHFVNGEPKFKKGPKERSIGIIRDPRDVLVSISRWDMESLSVGPSNGWSLANPRTKHEWCKRWKEAYYWIRKNTTLRVKYEDLLCDFKTEVEILSAMLGTPLPNLVDLMDYASISRDSGHGSGGGIGGWKSALDKKTAAFVLDKLGPEMDALGYARCDSVPGKDPF